MNTFPKKLLVVIGEAALEKFLVRDIKAFGAHGYTVADVRGGGEHGIRDGEWDGSRSIRMEVICEESVAEKIAEHVIANYAKNFSLSLYVSDVSVIRKEKF
ncbi:MAG: P-II family nitrogen regulator [Burkholderiales bacterium]